MYFLQKPNDVLSEISHVGKGFCIFFCFADIPCRRKVPIGGPRDDHTGDQQKVIHGIIRAKGTAPTVNRYSRTHLPGKRPPHGAAGITGTVNQGLHLCGNICKIGGGPQYNSICRQHFVNDAVNDIIINGAMAILHFLARHAGPAAADFVDFRKQDKLRTTASIYLAEHPTQLQPRFDVIEIYAPQGTQTACPEIIHLENAFE